MEWCGDSLLSFLQASRSGGTIKQHNMYSWISNQCMKLGFCAAAAVARALLACRGALRRAVMTGATTHHSIACIAVGLVWDTRP